MVETKNSGRQQNEVCNKELIEAQVKTLFIRYSSWLLACISIGIVCTASVTPTSATNLKLTLSATPTRVEAYDTVVLTGVLSTKKAGQRVTIYRRISSSQPFKKVSTVKTGARGKYQLRTRVDRSYTYESRVVMGDVMLKSQRVAVKTMPFSIITPYVNEADITSVNEAFSLTDDNPYWGFRHPGVDFNTATDLVPVRAAAGGVVTLMEIEKSSGEMGWHAGFCIEYSSRYGVCYNLETFSATDETGQKLRENLFIKKGQTVKRGDRIANLVYGGSGTHIDFGVTIASDRICPEPFFTTEAKESVMRLIHKDHPDWPMCTD
jgi:murein DD-endopeptidase MepM/ murein hydrolase activator NlpD